jgi:uncharacterized Zn finger protein
MGWGPKRMYRLLFEEGETMKCERCGIEMEQIPSVIEIEGKKLGDPNIKMSKCHKCKIIRVEKLPKDLNISL